MRLSRASSARLVVAAAAVLTAVAGSAVAGSAAALGSTARAAPAPRSRASDPGAMIVHPAAGQVRGAFMAPVPFSDAQCEAIFRIDCFVPDQVEAAYNLPALYSRGITGKGRTIVVVDAFGSPTIADDLLQFDQNLGLGTPALRIVQVGHVPTFNSGNGDMVGWQARPRWTWSTRTPARRTRRSCWSRWPRRTCSTSRSASGTRSSTSSAT